MKDTRRMYTERIGQWWRSWQEKRSETVCYREDGQFLARRLVAGQVVECFHAPCSSLREGLARAVNEGFGDKRLTVLVNTPLLRTDVRVYPDMTEEELAETMAWEREEGRETAYHILAHDGTGYTVLVCSCPTEFFTEWEESSQSYGRYVTAFVPVTACALTEGITVYGGQKEAVVILRHHETWRVQRLSYKDREKKWSSFWDSIRGESAHISFIRLSDCDDETARAWQELTGGGGGEDEGAPLFSAYPHRLHLTFPRAKTFRVSHENRVILGRLMVGVLAMLLLCQGLYTVFLLHEEVQGKEKLAELAWIGEEKRTWEAERQEAAALRHALQTLDKEDEHWQTKLIDLAQVIPGGVVLKSIEKDGASVRLEGTADTGKHLEALRTALTAYWGGSCRIEKGERKAGGYQVFTLHWQKEEER